MPENRPLVRGRHGSGPADRHERLAYNDIIGHVLKHQELAEIEARLEAIEERLAAMA